MTPPILESAVNRCPWQVFAAVIAILPAGLMLGARHMSPDLGPRAARAAASAPNMNATLTVTADGPKPLTREQERLSQDFARYDDVTPKRPRFPAPLHVEPSTIVPVASGAAESTVVAALTSIMATRSGPIAIIGGKMRRAGERVGQGWRVESIDPKAGRATIVHTDGRTQDLFLRKPASGN